MEVTVAFIAYTLAVPLWIYVWWSATGFRLMRHNRLLMLPFGLSLLYLVGNAALLLAFGEISQPGREEARIAIIVDRSAIAVQATASVLIVATIVYGLSIKRVPLHFIRFMVYAFVAILGLMAPILWIPVEEAALFFVLRHLQSVALNFGLFLCVAGIVVLLQDLLTHGDARVSLMGVDAVDSGDDESGEGRP